MRKDFSGPVLSSGSVLFAQTDRGAITGVITDPASAPIPRANVRAVHEATDAILLDGGSAANPESGSLLFTYPSVEAIGEFKLVSSSYAAEYGRTGSGFEVFTTRSGTNDFHGALFNSFRNDAFDARVEF
ncbi:MAG TPA: hypothetical protein VES20_19400 [Bryobacteraceae bacterium]|nr:hypothetical protein [Bryobacteraceae bacterium]